MGYAFSHLEVFENALRHTPSGLILDVDGVVSADIGVESEPATVLCEHLKNLSGGLDLLSLISKNDARRMCQAVDINNITYLGSNGTENITDGRYRTSEDFPESASTVNLALNELDHLSQIEGLAIQKRGLHIHINYKNCRNPQSVMKLILMVLQESPIAGTFRISRKTGIFELMPPSAPSKTWNILELIDKHQLRSLVYIGCDASDIPIFREVRSMRNKGKLLGFTVAVARPGILPRLLHEADFTLSGLPDTRRFLEWLSQTMTPAISV